jgi:L-ascorbate metabolism protein UlaG (beta-lactamase superfamily)
MMALSACILASLAPAGAAQTAETIGARKRYFGAANVDPSTGALRPDRVILSWFGVTNFAAAIGGHVVLLDGWVPRGEFSGYVPSSPAELATLKPEFIFTGHGHFDHMADAAEIITLSPSTTLVGTPEHCAQVREQAMGAMVRCLDAVPEGSAPGTEDMNLSARLGWSDVHVSVIKHIHSAGRSPDSSDAHTPVVPPPDMGVVVEHRPNPEDTIRLVNHLGDEEAGVLLYRFDVGNFSLAWHDSSGPLKQDAPELLVKINKDFAPVDVELGAIMGFNQITNGLADPRTYTEALRPRVFVPTHHDNWAPPVSTKAANYRPAVEAELQEIDAAHRPQLLFIEDPEDYVNPETLAFAVGDAKWGPATASAAKPRGRVTSPPAVLHARPLPATGVGSGPWELPGIAALALAAAVHRVRRSAA